MHLDGQAIRTSASNWSPVPSKQSTSVLAGWTGGIHDGSVTRPAPFGKLVLTGDSVVLFEENGLFELSMVGVSEGMAIAKLRRRRSYVDVAEGRRWVAKESADV